MSEYLSGLHRHAAQRWAEKENYPLVERCREELPQIAQYLTNRDGPAAPRKILIDHILEQSETHFAQALSADLPGDTPEETLEKRIAAIARHRRSQFQNDAYSVLAGLPFYIYINTNPDNLLTQALLDAAKQPVVDFSRAGTPPCRTSSNTPLPTRRRGQRIICPAKARPLVDHSLVP